MENKKEIKVVVQLRNRFVSVNSLYKSRISYVAGKPRAVVYKNPKAVDIENEVREQLRALDMTPYLEWLRETKAFKLHIQFIFKKGITNSDTSNYIKNIEDIFTRFVKEDLGIDNYDDCKHVEISAVKSIIPKSKHEYACIHLSESKFNIRFDQEEKPERVKVIGGEKDIKEVRELVENNKAVIVGEGEEPDTHLYILTDENHETSLVIDLVDSIWRCVVGDLGFVVIKSEGDRWKKVLDEKIKDLIESNGNGKIKLVN